MKAKTLNAVAATIGVFCLFFTASAFAAAKYVTLSCSGYTGTTTLTNFQALVKLTEGVGGFSYSDCEANGTDLWFTDASGSTVYPHEVDTWNTSGESFVWVRLPEVVSVTGGGTPTTFTMHWGDLAAKQTTSVNVWKNYNDGKGGFAGVWHMGTASGAENEPNAVGDGLDGIPRNKGANMGTAAGVVGGSRANLGASSGLRMGGTDGMGSYSDRLSDPAKFTISGWWKLSSWLKAYPRFFEQVSSKWMMSAWNSWGDTYINNAASGGVYISPIAKGDIRTASFVNNWLYLTVVFDGTTLSIYSNGSMTKQYTGVTANTNYDDGFLIGNNAGLVSVWNGYYDEVRMADGALTADRIKADYDTMSDPDSFLTFMETHETTLRATGYAGTTTLTNFQALVKISESAGGFSYSQCSANYGADLWFTDSAGNVIPHEIDTWNPSGDSFVWVRLPELSPASQGVTSFTMHWGDFTAKQTTSVNVWKNYNDGKGGFAGVWHMGTASGTTAEPDATGNGLDAVPTVNYGTGDLTAMTTTPGIVGNGRINQTNTGYVQGLKVPDYSASITDASKFTISGWWTATALNTYPRFVSAKAATTTHHWLILGYANDGNGIDRWKKISGICSNGDAGKGGSSTPTFEIDSFKNSEGNWVYLTVVWDGTTLTAYSNGAQKHQNTSMVAQTALDSGFMIGGDCTASSATSAWRGYYDEVRMYDGAQTADRVKADYDTMSAPDTFVTYNMIANWTGAANDGNGTNPLNWECRANGVVVAGQLPNVTYQIQSCTLFRDCDWSGLGTAYLAPGAIVEMNGHALTLPAVAGAGTVQNSASGDAKELIIALASDCTNGDTAFTGNLKLVKTGDGVLTSSIAQSYTGGTEVRRGTIQAPQSTAAYNASFTPFGTGTITVNSNAVLNAQSTVAYTNSVILNGGTIRGGAGSGSANQRPIVMLERVTEDSSINQAVKAIEIGVAGTTTDLNGHTVAVSIAYDTYFRWYGSLEGVTGKIVTSGAGFFQDMPDEARGIDFDVASDINFSHAVHVRNFRAANPNSAIGTGTMYGMHVHGTYIPVNNYYYGCIMEDGSMLDLSARTGYFTQASVISALNGATAALQNARKSVQFPDNGTVTVNLAGRTDLKTIAESESNYIVKWNSYYGQPTTTKFQLDAETAQKFSLRSDTTGLRLNKKRGLVIIVK